MNRVFGGWTAVAARLEELAQGDTMELNDGQRWSLRRIAQRLPDNGLVLADEVGMGKTRVASAVASAVAAAGGRIAVLVPPGLGYQWLDELRAGGTLAPPILRSLQQFRQRWDDPARVTPWLGEACVVISHVFCNHWKLGPYSAAWRWGLLPELCARWRKKVDGRFPAGYAASELGDEAIKRAADGIVDATWRQGPKSASWALVADLATNTRWADAVDPALYSKCAALRAPLESAVGLGLGVFDLVIIDEAHKARSTSSGLSQLLDSVIVQSRDARRLAMTATPVELDISQWRQMFERIRAPADRVQPCIERYADAVARIRLTPRDADAREGFATAAREFERTLRPYLLRRDKREDATIKRFVAHTNQGHQGYRKLSEVSIRPQGLKSAWKQSVCAAEALSFAASHADDPVSKRIRLTLGNGHGISSLIEHSRGCEKEDELQAAEDGTHIEAENAPLPAVSNKRVARSQWWREVLLRPFENAATADDVLYDHPAILAAVQSIEPVVQRGEKVLVFGRFTRPMRALVQLLNARAMLLAMDTDDGFWPQEQVHASEWSAVEAAHRQLDRSAPMHRAGLDERLRARYKRLEASRESFRDGLVGKLESGLATAQAGAALISLFAAFKSAVVRPGSDRRTLATIARALSDHLGTAPEKASDSELAVAFGDLVTAASDHDVDRPEDQQELSIEAADARWEDIEKRVREEYSHAQGGFARLMHGSSPPPTRRLLQLAFNRKHAFPRVLVAQSMVGREGLNLHKACRTVLLLHPEWNPGVVEQQIGRVDRLGSLWEELVDQAISDGALPEDVPRIEVLAIVFEGTYDQSNWQVLKQRWNQLRAQLHGVILTPHDGESGSDTSQLFDDINRLAPCFSPVPQE